MIRHFKKWAWSTKHCEPVVVPDMSTSDAYHSCEKRLVELQTTLNAFYSDEGRGYREHQHILAATMLGVGTNLTAKGQPRRALNFQRIGLAVSPKIVEGYLHLLETCVHLRQTDIALEAFAGALSLPIAPTPVRGGPSPNITLDILQGHRQPPVSPVRITIFTSLMPRRLDVQKAAIESWLRAGFVIRSVNVRKEIDVLSDVFPDVGFIEFKSDDGFLVPISHLCKLMAEDENPIVGIVNSDIIFLDAANLVKNIQSEHRDSLVFGHRYDLQSPADTIGRAYEDGFDYFFMQRKNWNKAAGTSLLMGAPFWDYWVPLVVRLHGLILKKPRDAQIVHMMHPLTYDTQISLNYARKFWRDFAIAARAIDPGTNDDFAWMLCRAGRMLTDGLPADTPENFNRMFDFGSMAKIMIDANTLKLD